MVHFTSGVRYLGQDIKSLRVAFVSMIVGALDTVSAVRADYFAAHQLCKYLEEIFCNCVVCLGNRVGLGLDRAVF